MGLGACVTAPIPSLIVVAGANLAVAIADEVSIAIGLDAAIAQRDYFVSTTASNIGVTYQSGSGDYAEWLPKANNAEKFKPGYIVGMKNGRISLNAQGADKLFVISTKPIVLGNMPDAGDEANYEKVAFMGQVPVHVLGKVKAGDYILPSGNNNGYGKAVSPADMQASDYANIVGMAWSSSNNNVYNLINVAIGLNAGDISKVVAKQHDEINALKGEITETNNILAKLLPGFKEAAGISTNVATAPVTATIYAPKITTKTQHDIFVPNENTIEYFQITDAQINQMLALARQMFIDRGGDENKDLFWSKMKNNQSYKAVVTAKMKEKLSQSLHYHKMINGGKFSN